MSGSLATLLATQRRRHRRTWRQAGLCAALAAVASVALLGVSGWFLASAAAAGGAGLAAATAFNYLLPSACIRLLAILRTGARHGERLLGHASALRSMAHLRPMLFDALCAARGRRAPAAAAAASSTTTVTTGEATTALMQDLRTIEDHLIRGTAVRGALAALACGAALVALAGWPALLVLAMAALLIAASIRHLSRRARAAARAVREATGALKEELGRLAAADVELRCYGLESWAHARIAASSRTIEVHQGRLARVDGWIDAVLPAVAGLAVAATIALTWQAGAPLAALAALAMLMALEGLGPWTRGFAQRGAVQVATRHLDRLLDPQRTADATATATATPCGPSVVPDHESPHVAPCIDLRRPVRAHLRAGDRIALVGPSGCGKTTLVEQLLGLRPIDPGTVLVDGIDLADHDLDPDLLRRAFAWSPQDALLLGATVRENLALAGADIDETAMWLALRDAALDERVRALPQGLDTWLGEDGARLSGGERRRLSLARACLSEAPWLLLDEPTEGLDAVTEARVVERLARRLERTRQGLILVSHRPAPLALCHDVVRLDASPAPRRPARPTGRASTARAPRRPAGSGRTPWRSSAPRTTPMA